ncbi:hypothetical protein M8A51_13605 [Schlegelella sp. S2-27]|uniref:Uncharacterized protein n=1 Tax=Caldimonas mangrovi TaxID=2944811 RepID=A0ABT0YPH0_9BURK|nr:hypothetical protein [Caldimonas mangrovi]MCM5680563.1 hypothetical protein [Caldimonas mangrovi]
MLAFDALRALQAQDDHIASDPYPALASAYLELRESKGTHAYRQNRIDRQHSYILMYPITFDPHPLAAAGWSLTMLQKDNRQFSREEISTALGEALQQTGWSSQISAIGHHSEDKAKEEYLRVVKENLEFSL